MMSRQITIDCQRLLCPMPVIRVQDRIAEPKSGDQVTAVCTDPGVLQDIPAWCRINGHAVLAAVEDDGEYRVTVQVGG